MKPRLNSSRKSSFDLAKEKPEIVEFDGRNWERSVGQLG